MLQNAAYARPESQNIKLDVFSVMRKSEKRNRPETARAVLMGRRTEARKIVFGGPVRNSGFGVATGGRLSQKRPCRPRLVQSARLSRSPRKIVRYNCIDQSVQTISRCEETSQKPKSNREKSAHSAKPRRRNIQSASRAYEKRRKPGSVSPRRERRPRPHSANVGMRRYGGGYKAPFYTTVRPTRTFSPV